MVDWLYHPVPKDTPMALQPAVRRRVTYVVADALLEDEELPHGVVVRRSAVDPGVVKP